MLWIDTLLLLGFAALPQDPPTEEPAPRPEAEREVPPKAEDSDEAEEAQEEEKKLTPEEAVEMLQLADKSDQLDLIFVAIEEAGLVADKKVVRELADLLKHKDSEVRFQTLQALRYNKDPEALKVLLKQKKNKDILENERCAEEYYYALGQKGDPKAIDILSDDLNTTNRGDQVNRARILALGHIRDVESVEALISVMVSGKARRAHPQMTEIHLSLSVLTGAEVKPNKDDWLAWWNDNKRGFEMTEAEQEISSRKGRAAWMTLWATPEDKELMELARKAGKDGFADATPEELEELRKKAEERKKRAEEKAKEAGGDGGESGDGR